MAGQTDTGGTGPDSRPTPVPPRLRTLFAIHGLAQLGFAVSLVLGPTTLAGLLGWGEPFDPAMSRLAGSFLFGLGLGQVLASRAGTWAEVRLLYAVVVSETVVGFVAVVYQTLSGGFDAAWLVLPLFVVFAPAFAYYLPFYRATPG